MSIVVTGAAGFIGSHLSKKIEETHKTRIILVDDFSRGKQKYLDYLGVKSKCLKVDLRDYCYVKGILKNADVVYHTACRIGGEQFLHGSPEKEFNAYYENSLIDNNILKGCIENKVKKIIFTSSCSVHNTKKQYDSPTAYFYERELDVNKTPLDGIDPEGGYGWAKLMTEINLGYLRQAGIKTGVARIWKAYGPCDDYSPESGQVVCSLMRKALNYPKEPFIVWGNGEKMRNLVYIDDLISGLMKMNTYLDIHDELTVNLGGKVPIVISSLAYKIAKLSGKNIKIEYDKTKSGGPRSRIGVLERAKRELNWEPKVTLDEGLQKTWEWMKNEQF